MTIMVLLFLLWPQTGLYVGPADVDAPIWATTDSFNAAEVPFCRGYYTSSRYEANGAGWLTDYPGADINLLTRLGELTTIRPGKAVVVRLDDPLLVQCPVLFMSDVGTMSLSGTEVRGLRNYLLRGGFLWVDDFWGSAAWDQWALTVRLVLPQHQMRTLTREHPIFNQQYAIPGIWQQPTTGRWFKSPDGRMMTSEREDSPTPYVRAIVDVDGHVMVLMTYNTDIADGWEAAELAENIDYYHEFAHRAYALGVNVFLYALSH